MPRKARIPARKDHTRCEFCGAVVTAKYGCDCELSTWIGHCRKAWPGLIVEEPPEREHANTRNDASAVRPTASK